MKIIWPLLAESVDKLESITMNKVFVVGLPGWKENRKYNTQPSFPNPHHTKPKLKQARHQVPFTYDLVYLTPEAFRSRMP